MIKTTTNIVLVPPPKNILKVLNNESRILTNGNHFPSYSIITASSVVFFLTLIAMLGLYGVKKFRDIKKRENNRIQMTERLSKCMQQYVTNPNYYASSPDGAIFKLIRDIEINENSISLGEQIGEGCFGTVYKGTYHQLDGSSVPVAIKVLKDKNECKDDFEREIEIISSFNHNNIIRLIGVVVKDSHSLPYMVFEYMMSGDLAEWLRTRRLRSSHSTSTGQTESSDEDLTKIITHDMLIWISAQIASGCKYLADNHFVHRDLATRNCLVGEGMTVKISDFGMARDIYTCDYYKVGGSKLLPVRWMSPESILYGKFTLESDVWSFGVVLWEIFTLGKQPYFGHNNEEVVKLILQGILLIAPEDCPKIIYELMAGCWKTEPNHRINFNTIFNQLVKSCSKDRQKLLIENDFRDEQRIDFDSNLGINSYFATNYSD